MIRLDVWWDVVWKPLFFPQFVFFFFLFIFFSYLDCGFVFFLVATLIESLPVFTGAGRGRGAKVGRVERVSD